MKHIIIGTAGHVDHGKTTLIRALTGTDTDRLKEEQERGMTIDLGFAALVLPDGTPAGIVDVPGHERFLKNMLAGAAGIDVVLLVIAADESVMPQTQEHLDILRLLEVKSGVVALTKIDMVDPDWLTVVEDDIRSQLEGTFLERAPIIQVNSVRGKGIQELKKALQSAVSRTEAKNAAIPFRLPVDRVFTRPGFGTVITGTLTAGTLRIGDSVEVLPERLQTRVRGLQSHGKKQEQVEAGTRVAVNLAGIETNVLERGVLLVPPGSLAPTQVIDATIRLLPSAPKGLKDRARVRLHIGTAEILGRVRLLGTEEIAPGSGGYLQFRAEETFACGRGDRFVLRSYSPMRTIGGGVVLDAAPGRHRRQDAAVVAALQAKERGTPEDLLETWLQSAPYGGLRKEAAQSLGMSDADLSAAVKSLVDSNIAVGLGGERLIHRNALATATDRVLSTLNAYHTSHPLRPGMPKEELRGTIGRNIEPRSFSSLLSYWQAQGHIVTDAATVRCANFTVSLNPRQQALLERVADSLRAGGYNTSSVEEISAAIGAPPDAIMAMLRVGQDQGLVVRIAEGLYYHRDTFEEAKRLVRKQVEAEGSITVSQFRDLTGSSRKYALPLLEYLDALRFTRRVGDARVLANPD